MLFSLGVHAKGARPERVCCHSFHLRVNILEKVIFLPKLFLQIGLQLLIRQFIALLKPSVVREKLLNSVVGEMNTGLAVVESVLCR